MKSSEVRKTGDQSNGLSLSRKQKQCICLLQLYYLNEIGRHNIEIGIAQQELQWQNMNKVFSKSQINTYLYDFFCKMGHHTIKGPSNSRKYKKWLCIISGPIFSNLLTLLSFLQSVNFHYIYCHISIEMSRVMGFLSLFVCSFWILFL